MKYILWIAKRHGLTVARVRACLLLAAVRSAHTDDERLSILEPEEASR